MISQNELEVIRFIEDEHQINELIVSMVDTNTIDEIKEVTDDMFVQIASDISDTLSISNEAGIVLYTEYIDLMEKVAMLLSLQEN